MADTPSTVEKSSSKSGTENPDPAKAQAEALVLKFKYEGTLNQDQAGRRIVLKGTIDAAPALLTLERAPFPESPEYLAAVPGSLRMLRALGANDIYSWYQAQSGSGHNVDTTTDNSNNSDFWADLKINLIYPCTEQHIRKYSRQGVRFVTETPRIYVDHVQPFMASRRGAGRLNWVYNIIEGRTEQADIIYRTPFGADPVGGFLLLPDLNWDRTTLEALHLLCLVERRDLWSLRDLRKHHLPWLRDIKDKIIDATTRTVTPDRIEPDQLKLYVHYQPTYYHFHIHVVHVQLDAGTTQATGKAVGLESIMETLAVMPDATAAQEGEEEPGMHALSISYVVGEESDLWTEVWGPLKRGEAPSQPSHTCPQ